MEKITRDQLYKTKEFLDNYCRELEIAQFEFFFGNGSKENVMEKLKKFQNADGGFGHGLEPDFWLPTSSPMATWAAGQILMELDVDKDVLMVKKMISYLVDTYDEESGKWASVLPEFNNYPHAPWWHWEEGVQENWSFNPSIELAAFLIHWSDSESQAAKKGWRSIEKATVHLLNQTEMDNHEINNFQAFSKIIEAHSSSFEDKTGFSYEEVSKKIVDLAYECINKDVTSWDSGYVPLPLDFINNPDSSLCTRLGSLVQRNFEFYIYQMSDKGVWDITWGWGSYPEEFEKARIYWKGILAVERYKKFKAFGYLE
ncbi:hypothetical protein [Paucisalibacillus globulus]|uniref:hypothetical protein n=1 Tax=Paucisalibacillus globulus TaxID=351095 RepID=UPI00042581FC|nr:hypothetical protein [Paucisalibacillus globulus]